MADGAKGMLALLIFLLALSAVSASTSWDDVIFSCELENATVLSSEAVPDGTFTSLHNQTFHLENAQKYTYRTPDGKVDYLIIWESRNSNDSMQLAMINDYMMSYSDYTKDNKSVFYIEEPYIGGNTVWGILLDTQNISYTEKDLVHDILHKNNRALTNENQPVSSTVNGGGGSYFVPSHSHYKGVVIEPYDIARNDPYSYYDYFDYEDNVDIDEYLYDNGYDE